MASNGWVKIHRKMFDNPIVCKDADHLAVWIYLLLQATHKEMSVVFDKKRMTLKKGQLITGRKIISEKTKVSESKVQRIIKSFVDEQQIEQQTTNRKRLITVINWELYQETEQQSEQQLNSTFDDFEELQFEKVEKSNSKLNNKIHQDSDGLSTIFSGGQCETEQQIEQQLNNKRTTSTEKVNTNKNVYTNKNDKNERIKRHMCDDKFDEFWDVYPNKKAKKVAKASWDKIQPDETLADIIIDSVIKYKRSYDWIKENGKYVPMPSTFLNQERWEDEVNEYEPPKPTTGNQFIDIYLEERSLNEQRTDSATDSHFILGLPEF